MKIDRLGPKDVDRLVAAGGLFDGPTTAEWATRFLTSAGHHALLASIDGNDIGFVTGPKLGDDGTADGLVVDFDGRRVEYDVDALFALELAYAVSIHKSQGSEYPAVVVPLVGAHHVMLRRNLLYTAITRGRALVVLVVEARALRRAVSEVGGDLRDTGLAARLAPDAARVTPG